MTLTPYQRGYLRKFAEAGASDELLERVATTLGVVDDKDDEENDYGPGIADMLRNAYTSGRVMAQKQRRFERDYLNATGAEKFWMGIKHPFRAHMAGSRLQIPGGMGMLLLAALLAGDRIGSWRSSLKSKG